MRKPEGNLRVLSGFSCQSPRPAALPPSIYLHCTVEEPVGAKWYMSAKTGVSNCQSISIRSPALDRGHRISALQTEYSS